MLSISCHNNSRHSYTAWLSNDGACTMNTKQDGQYWLQLQLCVHALPSCCAGDSQYYIYCLFYRHLVLYVTCCMLQEGTVFQAGRQTGDRRHPSTSESLVFTLDRHLQCLHVLLHPLSLMTPPPPPPPNTLSMQANQHVFLNHCKTNQHMATHTEWTHRYWAWQDTSVDQRL